MQDDNVKFDNKMNFREAIKNFIPKEKEDAKIYLYGTGDNWNNTRRMYHSLGNIWLENYVDFFVDGNAEKQGKYIGNTKIVSVDEINIQESIVFITSNQYEHEIGDFLAEKGWVARFDFYDSFYLVSILFEYVIGKTIQLRDSKKGEKCFIIGNGPSLLTRDLEILEKNNIDTFSVNQIYKIFQQTTWRPTYYVATDYYAVKNFEIFNKYITGIKFINLDHAKMIEGFYADNAYYFIENIIMLFLSHLAKPKISEDIYDLCSGGTSVFIAIQLAFYLGYSEIYLLGVDNSFQREKSYDGELLIDKGLLKTHFVEDYHAKTLSSEIFDVMFGYQNREAYKAAFEYAREHGKIIRNATRGGKLEEIERIDFDSIFA